jgi:hypothetical protein
MCGVIILQFAVILTVWTGGAFRGVIPFFVFIISLY